MVRIICKECKEFLPKFAKGLCMNCYQRLKTREYREKNPKKYRKRTKEFQDSHRDLIRKSNRKSYINHKYKRLIKSKDTQKIKELKEKINQCGECGSKENLEGHHVTYNNNSVIRILCIVCHRKLHRK